MTKESTRERDDINNCRLQVAFFRFLFLTLPVLPTYVRPPGARRKIPAPLNSPLYKALIHVPVQRHVFWSLQFRCLASLQIAGVRIIAS